MVHAVPLPTSLRAATFPPGEGIGGGSYPPAERHIGRSLRTGHRPSMSLRGHLCPWQSPGRGRVAPRCRWQMKRGISVCRGRQGASPHRRAQLPPGTANGAIAVLSKIELPTGRSPRRQKAARDDTLFRVRDRKSCYPSVILPKISNMTAPLTRGAEGGTVGDAGPYISVSNDGS